MTLDFFADSADKADLLNFIFNETSLSVFDHYSSHGEEIREYKSADEIMAKFDLQIGGAHVAGFQLWSEAFKAKPVFSKVDLDPKRCNGHTFRYATSGWGLIQLYFGGLQHDCLRYSHIGHFNEKGALKNEDINKELGKVDSWDWKEVGSTGNKLRYYIMKKLTVNKLGTYPILKGAEELRKSGVDFR